MAREADEWNSHAHTPEVYRVKRAKLEEHCRAVGRDPTTIRRSWMGGALLGRDAKEVAEKGRWMQSFLGALSGVPPAAAAEELRRRCWIIGTPFVSLNSLRSDARARDNDSIAERHGGALRCRENTQALDREHRQSAYKQRAQRMVACA